MAARDLRPAGYPVRCGRQAPEPPAARDARAAGERDRRPAATRRLGTSAARPSRLSCSPIRNTPAGAWSSPGAPGLARALGAEAGECPDPWPGELYDLILRFDCAEGSGPKVTALTMPF